MIIGITGGTGCGKTTALRAIRALGGQVYDCDTIYHRLLETDHDLLAAIERRFPGVVREGALQRKELGELVFSDPEALADLNRITHSAVCAQVTRALAPRPALAAVDAIALIESGLHRLCDATVAITAPREARISRLMARDSITRQYAALRIDAQKPQSFYEEACDYTLQNDRDEDAFYQACITLFQTLIQREKKENAL